MADTEHESLPEDEEVEITDLDQPGVPLRPHVPRLTPRQRKVSLVLTVALFVLAIGFMLSSVSGFRNLLAQNFFRSPSPTPVSGDLTFYLRGNPTWGQFTIDGKTLAQVPEIGHDRPLTLAPGRHTIVWRIEPFKTRTCTLTVINISTVGGPCFVDNGATAGFIQNVPAMVISFFASLDDLPANQRAALVQQIQARLDQSGDSETVRPGEVYAVSSQMSQANPSLCKTVDSLSLCYARANEPLKATLSLQLDTSSARDDPCAVSGQCRRDSQDCRAFCDDTNTYNSHGEADGWNVDAVVYLLWSYHTLSGRVIASDQPDSAFAGSPTYQFASLHLDLSADHTWHIVLFFDSTPGAFSSDPLCSQAVNDVMQLLQGVSGDMYVNQTQDNYQQRAAGCLTVAVSPQFSASRTPSPAPVTNPPPQVHILHRFGVMLAADDTTHRLCPYLPVVDSYEKSVVAGLLISLSPST